LIAEARRRLVELEIHVLPHVMYSSYIMKRTQIYLDDEHDRRLAARARASGRSKSALIRQAIDAFLEGEDEEARLRRFRAATSRAAGAAPDLRSGADYVPALRARDRARAAPTAERSPG